MTALPPVSSIACTTCRELLTALGEPLENVYTKTEWIYPADRWVQVPERYLVGAPRTRGSGARRAICRVCGRRAQVADYGGNRGKLEITVKEDLSRAPSVVPLIDCTRCAALLAHEWPRVDGAEYELMGGDPDSTHGPMGYTPGSPGTDRYPPCRECGRVVSVVTEYRSSGWYTRVPLRRP